VGSARERAWGQNESGSWAHAESVVKTGRESNSDCADAKLRGRVIASNGVPMTEARVTRSPVMGNYHAGFWSGSGPGDRPTDRSGADPARGAKVN
jgi:hypothetical protein